MNIYARNEQNKKGKEYYNTLLLHLNTFQGFIIN